MGILTAILLAQVTWRGDFTTGDLSQWSWPQEVSADRLKVVPGPDAPPFVLQVTVKQGDAPLKNATGNRAELVRALREPEGAEAFFKTSIFWPASYPSDPGWILFWQFHQASDFGGSPPIQFWTTGETVKFSVSMDQTLLYTAPLIRGVWHSYILHVKFSDDPKIGFVELWVDGAHVVPLTHALTMAGDYLKLGTYRSTQVKPDTVIYQRGVIEGTTLRDVWPECPPSECQVPAQVAPKPTPAAMKAKPGWSSPSAPKHP